MRSRRKQIGRGMCCITAVVCMVYCWNALSSERGDWEMTQYPKEAEERTAELQYFSPSINVYYGKKLSVSPSLLRKLNVDRDRDDFVQVTDAAAHEYVIVTATDSGHYGGAFSLIYSIHRLVRNPAIIVYDLGMTQPEMDELREACGVSIRRFKFEEYPAHVRTLSNYAWKPLMVHEVLDEWPSVLWLDSSVRLTTGHVEPMFNAAIQSDGLVMFMGTEYSTYAVTHPNMYRYFPTDLLQVQQTVQREAGEVMYYRTSSVYRNIVYWWVLCALDPDCIAPSRNGVCVWGLLHFIDYLFCHKYDQSALNILVGNHYKFELTALKPRFKIFTFVRHGPKHGRLRHCSEHL